MIVLILSTHVYRTRFGISAGGNGQEMAKMVSRGSAGSIAAMDQLNPRSEVKGPEPWVGVRLNVEWTELISMKANL